MRTFAEKPKATQQTATAKSTITGRAHVGHSPAVNSILHLQRKIGSQAVLRMMRAPAEECNTGSAGTASPHFGSDFSRIPIYPPVAGAIQTRLAINTPGDQYEQEADRVAEQVMRIPEPQLQCACGGGCPRCQAEQSGQEHERLLTERVHAKDEGETIVPPIVHEVLHTPGQPLDPATRASMEPRFRHDFSRVRVHTDTKAAESARAVNAEAYTVGPHVVFREYAFDPGTAEGKRLLAHELSHVIQQGQAYPAGAPTLSTALRLPGDAEGSSNATLDDTAPLTAQPRLRTPPQLSRQLIPFDKNTNSVPVAGPYTPGFPPSTVPPFDQKKLYQDYLRKGVEKLSAVKFGRAEWGTVVDPVTNQEYESNEQFYDHEFWEIDFQKKRLQLKQGKLPSDAIDAMFAHLDKWSLDCTQFEQVAQLYALRWALLPSPERFNQMSDPKQMKINLRFLGPEGSLGLKAEHTFWRRDEKTSAPMFLSTDIEQNFPVDIDAVLKAAPVGSRIVWTNEVAKKEEVFRNENAIKIGNDQFAAHGFKQHIFTRKQIELALARATNGAADESFARKVVFINKIVYYKQAGM